MAAAVVPADHGRTTEIVVTSLVTGHRLSLA